MASDKEPTIFISFVHDDQRVASLVKDFIESELQLKKGVFLSSDKAQVYAGDVWLDKIRKALESAKLVVLMLSKRSVRRPWVNFEAGGAWLTGKPILPCCYGNLKKDSLPHPYSAIQALDLPDEAHYLLESIHHHLGLTTPRPQTPFYKALQVMLEEKRRSADGRQEKAPSLVGDVVRELRNYYKRLSELLAEFEDEP